MEKVKIIKRKAKKSLEFFWILHSETKYPFCPPTLREENKARKVSFGLFVVGFVFFFFPIETEEYILIACWVWFVWFCWGLRFVFFGFFPLFGVFVCCFSVVFWFFVADIKHVDL